METWNSYGSNQAASSEYEDENGDVVTNKEEEVFVPLRKKLKRASTGREDNFMSSYFIETQALASRTDEEAATLRRLYGIEVEGEGVPKVINNFYELGLPNDILAQLGALGYEYPTPIQMQAIPIILNGRDMIGNAETGSGKTLAYILPLLLYLRVQLNKDHSTTPTQEGKVAGPLALILIPTHELVEQIYAEIEKFTNPWKNPYINKSHNSTSATLQYDVTNDTTNATGFDGNNSEVDYSKNFLLSNYENVQYPTSYDQLAHKSPIPKILGVMGGVSVQSQITAVTKNGVDVLVATPGRLIDLIERGVITTERLSYLVFDEADRMLSMNLEEQLRKIVAYCNICPRQTLLFSATMPAAVTRLARSAVLDPIIVMVGEVGQLAYSIVHDVIFVHTYQKKSKLLEVLRKIPKPPVIIFCNHSYIVDKVVSLLKSEQFHAAGIHSNKVQSYRSAVMKAFKDGQLDILVASDLVSRGIDVSEVSHVILYDMPETIEDYVHRSGRTGRFGRDGTCISFLTYDCKIAKELKKLLKQADQPIPKELEDTKAFGGEVVRTDLGDVPKNRRI